MDDKLVRAKVHTAVQQHCATSGVQPNPYLAQRVLAAARDEGVPVVKKKLSLGLVFILILLLTGTVALAVSLLWQDYVPQMKQTEHELGNYAEWPAVRRIQLAKDVVAMGYLDESEDTQILSSETATEQDKAAAADRLMLKLTGLEDLKEVHSTLITYAIMGHEDTWTPEQRVWWNGIVTMYGDDGAMDTLIVPTKDVLSEQDAIAIARAAIQEAYGFDDVYMNSLQPVANLYTTDERPNYKRWDIQFKKYREGSTSYVEKVYCAVVDENGEVISDPDVGIDHPAESVARLKARSEEIENAENPELTRIYEQYGSVVGTRSIWRLTLAEKAELLGNDNGIPRNEDISETQAVEIARKRLASLGYDLTSFEISVWYKVNTSAAELVDPFYVIYFVDNLDQPIKAFTVTINAVTGDVYNTYTPGTITEQ